MKGNLVPPGIHWCAGAPRPVPRALATRLRADNSGTPSLLTSTFSTGAQGDGNLAAWCPAGRVDINNRTMVSRGLEVGSLLTKHCFSLR